MEQLNGTWFETKVRFKGESERWVKEEYTVDAVSWGDAETKTFKFLEGKSSCIDNIKKAEYKNILLCEDKKNDDCRFFKVRLNFEIQSVSGKIKKEPETFLVEARSIQDAPKMLAEYLKQSLCALIYEQVSVQKTKVCEIVTDKTNKEYETY